MFMVTTLCCQLFGCREAIAARQGIPKVLLLNGSHDRETSVRSGSTGGMTAVDIVHAVSPRALATMLVQLLYVQSSGARACSWSWQAPLHVKLLSCTL